MTTLFRGEIWRKVPNVPLLWASSIGRVKSEEYQLSMPRGGYRTYRTSPTFGFTQKMSKNYFRKGIVFRGKSYRVHRLVAEAFLGPVPKGLVVSHKDEDSLNNDISNLEFITMKENMNKPHIRSYHKRVCTDKMKGLHVS